ncbi:MAG TPA: glycosyltransferase [Candidatus Acidoferrales bacterium]|nr:glycosyltransferase [Candidatus Acidoferrales bacterium]
MNPEKVILLLGRRDEPVDGVADYCEKLRAAGLSHGLEFEPVFLQWAPKGWGSALAELREAAIDWRDRWVLLQYTTLAWSRRGFPLRTPRVLDVLRQSGARPGVVFHDFRPANGSGIVGRVREYCQLTVLRQLYARSSLSIFTIPVEKLTWLPPQREKAVFIPVGSNFPDFDRQNQNEGVTLPEVSTVAVFGITGGNVGTEEVWDIVYALKGVHSRGIQLRLAAIGRGSEVFEEALRNALNGSGIELSMQGLMSADDLVQSLAGAQVQLCVRGHVSSRRGSAIAGIVCGLPIVGYHGLETGFPITEAGTMLVEVHDRDGLVEALYEVLSNEKLYRELRQRSAMAAQKYFSWDSIASQFRNAISAR